MKISQILESRDSCSVCGQTPCNCTHIMESTGSVGDTVRELYQQIYDQGDDALEYLNTQAPLFAQYWDQYEGDIESIIAELSPKNLIRIAQELKAVAAAEGLTEFAPPGGDDREPNEEEILRKLAAQWWNGTEQQMARAQQALEAMGWEIGPDESGDEDAGVYVYRIGDDDGRDTIAFGHSELELNEGGTGSGRPIAGAWDTSPGQVGRVEKTAQGIRHHADPSRYGGSETEPELDRLDKNKVNAMDKALGVKWDRESKRYYSPIKVDEDDTPEKELERLKLRQNAEHGRASLQRQAATQARIRELEKQVKDQQGVAEAPGAETLAHNQSTVASNEKAFDLEEGKPREKEADYGDDYQAMVARVKKLAGLGPLKTVYDPKKRVYRNMPTAEQPKK